MYPYDWTLPHVRYEHDLFHAIACDGSIVFVGEREVVARVASAMDALHLEAGAEPSS